MNAKNLLATAIVVALTTGCETTGDMTKEDWGRTL